MVWLGSPGSGYAYIQQTNVAADSTRLDSLKADTVNLDSLQNLPYIPSKRPTYRQKDRFGDPFSNNLSPSPLLLKDPSTLKLDVDIDTANNYTIYEKIGDIYYRPTTSMTFEEFEHLQERKMIKSYWKTRSVGLDGESAVSGRSLLPPIYISPVFDRIFGGSQVNILTNGFINLDLGGRFQRTDNPNANVRQQKTGTFEFDQQISMSVLGKIGEKLQITANFDNNNSFDFQNDLKLEYTGFEEDIIKKIEVGNVSLPLNNSLISGAQSLFGVKTQLQFGKLYVTALASEQRGRTEVIEIDGNFQGREFELQASEYDENRHFFLGHFFRDNYEDWLKDIPNNISSSLNISPRIEVYVLNRNNDTQSLRNFVGLINLGESSRANAKNTPTDNKVSELIDFSVIRNLPRGSGGINDELAALGLINGVDFETVTSARKLDAQEYMIDPELGLISLVRKLQNDEVLAVSFDYSFRGQNFKVGELREDYESRVEDEVIFLKLLRPRSIAPQLSTWDLMMKNIYSLRASQISEEGFQLRIIYRDDKTGIDNPSLQESSLKDKPLIRLMRLDRLNQNNAEVPDGNFDFIEGKTIRTQNGLIIFPVLEPFGKHLEAQFLPGEENFIKKFVFDTLYRTTKADAEQVTALNKYFITGRFQAGAASEIVLPGINIAEGSVNVFAGNTPLVEGLDYRVDYQFGKVSITNPGILNSGKKLRITYEKQDLFNFQTRFLVGSRFDYRFSEDINFGGTFLHLNQRPGGITRFRIGDEPTKNTKFGLDVNIRKDSRFLTRMVDAIPLLETKEPSNINFFAEYAQLIPGTSNVVAGEGTSYIDDFEFAATPFNLGGGAQSWRLASTPEPFDLSFGLTDDLRNGYKRAKFAWYIIDNVFYRSTGGQTPNNINQSDLENHYVRGIIPQEIFKQQQQDIVNTNLPIFDLAYFPSEAGPYNYNPSITPEFINGKQRITLPDAANNWGGIQRAITSDVDFDKTNIEYIEFWLLDPFVDSDNGRVIDGFENLRGGQRSPGSLFFNLGSITEDLIKDNKHGFENGLPIDDPSLGAPSTDETNWGRVTTRQFLNNAFDNSSSSRPNQDVGFDGLRDEEEKIKFPLLSTLEDPSHDNFQYYLDNDFDKNDIKILERYKYFNNTDGNTPILTNNNLPFSPSGTNIPDNEDLNADNTLSTANGYYEYEVSIDPMDLEVGENFIVDKSVSTVNGDEVTWYQFRIPIRGPLKTKVGNIEGFKSIRFVRTYLSGFRNPIVLRMANLQLVGSQWRRFLDEQSLLLENGGSEITEPANTKFEISVVNIEENSQGGESRIPYVVPPGINRDQDNTTTIDRRLNEQSLQFCVENLVDGNAKAVFKTVDFDLINYGRLKMFIHASNPNGSTQSGELTGFIRLGTDFNDNYYEVEVPLTITEVGTVDAREIWPLENEIDINFDELLALKVKRDREMADLREIFPNKQNPVFVGNQSIRVKGRPDLSSVRTIMIGVRNPRSPDGAEKSACLWVNELRVTDFDSQAGWATNARLSAKLADFALVNASTRFTSVGFGGIQTGISERTREESQEYDISANINLDKFLPEKAGLQIPMYVSYEKSTVEPKFDPADPDIPLSASLKSFETKEESDNYKKITTDITTRKSINFTNVRKVKTKENAKSRIYDIENLTFTFAFSELEQSNFQIADYTVRTHKGVMGYNFSPAAKSIEPFKNSEGLKSPFFKLIKDLNFSLIPSNLSFRADIERRFVKTQYREASNLGTNESLTNFEKSFTFNRIYNLRWNLTKNLSMDYSARASAVIDEPEGEINSSQARSEIFDNLLSLGRMKNFDQTFNFNYKVPFDKIPITDWVNSDLRYSVGYRWISGSQATDDEGNIIPDSTRFGNVIENNRERAINGKIDMVKLYNKIKYLQKINNPPRRRRRTRTQTADTTGAKNNKFAKSFLRVLMSLRSVNINYSVREGTSLPGFRPVPVLFGFDEDWDSPGLSFIMGSQNINIKNKATTPDANGNTWLIQDPDLTSPFTQNRTIDLDIKANVEPFKDFRITFEVQKVKTAGYREIFSFDTLTGTFTSKIPSRIGSYSISILSIKTAFVGEGKNNNSSIFDEFVLNRDIIKQRLQIANPRLVQNPGLTEYDINNQDVLIPAFLAAYTGKNANSISLSSFPSFPIPNWRIDYAGLSRLKSLRKTFSSVTLSHAYQSRYQITSYSTPTQYKDSDLIILENNIENNNFSEVFDGNDNAFTDSNYDPSDTVQRLLPRYQIDQVTITERFAPLIGINIRTKNKMTFRIEYNIERNLALNLATKQITELTSNDILFDFGYTKSKFKIPFKMQGRTVILENALSFRLGITIRDTKTVQRLINDEPTVTSGNYNFQLRPTISYVVNDKLNLQFYFDRNLNKPKTSQAFPRATTSFGVQVRFSLSQ